MLFRDVDLNRKMKIKEIVIIKIRIVVIISEGKMRDNDWGGVIGWGWCGDFCDVGSIFFFDLDDGYLVLLNNYFLNCIYFFM